MSYSDDNKKVLDDFFKLSTEKPWGRLVSVECTPNDLKKWSEGNIPATIKEVVAQPGWEDENSFDWAPKGSGNPIFYLFKIYEVWNSIRKEGVKTPLHAHYVANDNDMRFHPSNNKIEILCEFFPDMEVKVLYHDYNYLREFWDQPLVSWYKRFFFDVIDNTDDYLELFGLDQEHNEMEFGWEYCKRIIQNPDDVWGKVKPRAWDWKHIDITPHIGVESLENALFLTVTDRFHRMKMHENGIRLGDILKKTDQGYEFCGKKFSVD
jgi:hypothetical protein